MLNEPQGTENFELSGRAGATLVPTTTGTTATTIVYEWVEGYISHANDEDWFRFDIPGPDEPAPGHNGDYLIQIELEYAAPTPVELNVFLFGERRSYGGFGPRCRRPQNQDDTEFCQFPDEENDFTAVIGEVSGDCLAVLREDTVRGPHYLRFSDLDRDDFDLNMRYRFRVTLTADCPADSVCVGEFVDPGPFDRCADR
ncbi:MAG: hypothetical protein AAGK78_07685 [Planctomycetota bacterium]